MSTVNFQQLTVSGDDSSKFLQNQLTVNTKKLSVSDSYQPSAIANTKGRIEFGLWIRQSAENQFDIVTSSDCVEGLLAHLKKYGAFFKVDFSAPTDIYPYVAEQDGTKVATFSDNADDSQPEAWMSESIASGNFWIVADTQGQFQPQELRLHQRGGVDYDKGCYLGQEVIARIYFKASPKAFLHRVKGTGDVPAVGDSLDKIKVVNAIATDDGFEALVVARPEHIETSELEVLSLPEPLQGSVARPES
ncbi:YgfZ/GcvT domain-containing protein [Psychrobacter sp. FDAARGOS_221]|uniref:CAF17-like 4Fe-4S cluster assembly/insertion protein YgfZ n=1 Tax=Psychrobacter sp. FDAARGOS_221 TaxID=1975705 RepID=UPI000BB575FD|nr:folate-binding Fe/S cluster repair protein [Psychrobacter sp. FDAARGOS_221]PNK60432.1 folate-binding Fe/S cluster repair protein [Psychrobacter sp. FDAARGOS_221]